MKCERAGLGVGVELRLPADTLGREWAAVEPARRDDGDEGLEPSDQCQASLRAKSRVRFERDLSEDLRPQQVEGDQGHDELVDLMGLTSVSAATFDETLVRLAQRPAKSPFVYVVTPNAHHIVILSKPDSPLRAVYDAAWMRLCDSQILRAIAWLVSGTRLNLVAGSDLTLALLRNVVQPDDPVTIVGGSVELARALREQFGLQKIAQHIPPMGYYTDAEEIERCVRFVIAHPARFIFIVTGAPHSELVMLRIAQAGAATGVGLSVGSALDFATGLALRAPVLMRHVGLEWLFRLLTNPRRLLRRYVVDSTPIFLLAARWWFSLRTQTRSG